MINHIIVSDSSIQSTDASLVVQSNVRVTNEFLRNFLRPEELCAEALKSYYVNLYAFHMNNGGFAEFVYQTGWDKLTVKLLVDGLEDMGTEAHIQLLAKCAERLSAFGADGIACLYDDEHPQNQQMREFLNQFTSEFIATNEVQNLNEMNADWLKNHPQLVVMSDASIAKQIETSARAVPNRMQRIADALAKEPRHMKLIRLLCESAKLEFIELAPMDRQQFKASTVRATWQFNTVQGTYYLSDAKSEATLRNSTTHEIIASVQIDEVTVPRTSVH
jgi:hypothetical protein